LAPITRSVPRPRRFADRIKALTHGRGVDVVYDPVGGA
jgi:NADPH:quinone reductase-like Zn-dependent oxidoreductase